MKLLEKRQCCLSRVRAQRHSPRSSRLARLLLSWLEWLTVSSLQGISCGCFRPNQDTLRALFVSDHVSVSFVPRSRRQSTTNNFAAYEACHLAALGITRHSHQSSFRVQLQDLIASLCSRRLSPASMPWMRLILSRAHESGTQFSHSRTKKTSGPAFRAVIHFNILGTQ